MPQPSFRQAGEIIEFPEKLRQEIQTELEQSYAAKLKKAEDEFTTKVQQIEESQLEDIRLRVRNKLVELTKLAPE